MGVVGVRKCMAVRGGDGQGTSLKPWLPETRGGARMVHLVSCSTQHLSQGEELGLGVVSASVVAPGLSFKRGGIVQARTATAGCWLVGACSVVAVFPVF